MYDRAIVFPTLQKLKILQIIPKNVILTLRDDAARRGTTRLCRASTWQDTHLRQNPALRILLGIHVSVDMGKMVQFQCMFVNSKNGLILKTGQKLNKTIVLETLQNTITLVTTESRR
nr:unnamed protein product [Callosobruchus analis]